MWQEPPAARDKSLRQEPGATRPADQTAGEPPAPPSQPPPREPGGTGVLRVPGEVPRDVPLMSIQKDREVTRIEVGPLTRETGVADVLLGSVGLVVVILVIALVVGALVGVLLVVVKHRLGWGGPDKDAENHISITR